MSPTLISSPLQGYTEYKFRNAFEKHFGGIDFFYAPYIRLQGEKEIKSSNKRDLLPENNRGVNVLPQVMCKNAQDFLFVADYVKSLEYTELNWNLGCPYPMVTNRGMGAGLIRETEKIREILDEVFSKSNIEISIKMRLGNESPQEIEQLLPLLDAYPIKHITIHPRLGKQQYKGSVDLASFEHCLDLSKHPIIYNGDIHSIAQFRKLQERFPKQSQWMLGRGILFDPFLPQMIRQNSGEYPINAKELFEHFHNELLEAYSQSLSGEKHLLLKMFSFWEYFSELFSNSHKCLKKFKKAQNMHAYETAVREVLRNEEIVGIK